MAHSTPTDQGPELREVFAAALACPDQREQELLLQRLTRNDPELRRRVEAMLKENDQLDDFLLTPALGKRVTSPTNTDDLSGSQLGPYELIRVIGEGGGGIVYLASQKNPVRRQVALKILKCCTDPARVIPRFEAERHTLALMDHPGIAKVLDAGTTPDGSPYFVMEYVAGTPVTEYCDRHGLTIRERLTILIKICRAVEHAHQKGIIHRDLKPSNILIRQEDDRPVPKIIDFGVAKATDPFEGVPLKLTLNNPIIGTPAYMSPEQAAAGSRDLDTRADIYSLGVILFELLTGTTPLEATLGDAGDTREALSLLQSGLPTRPSTYLEQLEPGVLTNVATARGCPSKRLPAEIRGDLDWVVMTCLADDRNRRYGNCTDLARDLERHLEEVPIWARPPSWRYRMGRFLRRNRLAVCLSVILAAALLTITVVSYLSGVQARQARKTETELRLQAEQDRRRALARTQEARRHQYVAHMNLAQQALNNGHLSRARLLLERWLPTPSSHEDLRSFEWRYLMNRCRSDSHLTLPSFELPVDALSFSPDQRFLAIATRGQVAIWSNQQQEITSTFPYDGRTIDFSEDGSHLLVTGRDGVFLIDLASTRPIWELEGDGHHAALALQGSLLVTGGADGISFWDPDQWSQTEFFPLPSDSLHLSPDGRILATQNRDGLTLMLKDQDWAPVRVDDSSRSFPGQPVFRFSPDGRFLVLARNNHAERDGFALILHDPETGREIDFLARKDPSERHDGIISAMDFDRSGTHLVTGSWDHSVRIWNFPQGKMKRRLLGHRSEVWSVAISPDGQTVASGSKDGEVKIWPVRDEPRTLSIPGGWVPLAFSPDGDQLTAYHPDGSLATFDLETGEMVSSVPAPSPPAPSGRGIPVAQNTMRRVTKGEGGMIHITTLDRESSYAISSKMAAIDSLQLSPGGRWLVAMSRREGLKCWDLDAPAAPLIRDRGTTARFAAQGRTLLTIDRDGLVSNFDLSTGEKRSAFRLENFDRGSRVALSPDGSVLAMTRGFRDYENVISLFDPRSGVMLGFLKGHKQGIWDLAFSPDGLTLASSGSEGMIRLWNVATQTELLSIDGKGTLISSLTFSPDGRVLIAGSPGFSRNPELRVIRGLVSGP